ncbi:DUF342 domain-containing protein [Helicovermis profundi]|uniref:Flagellar Assembly Protein A N-terminal region domain-containing protein n=1 Tax=Helicovermis profundi TaxID=3065157 RepID=A0AAU9ESC2_9FIRM|nr:hypothetical protein HLPR_16810 [Clostridia bacterium S502]
MDENKVPLKNDEKKYEIIIKLSSDYYSAFLTIIKYEEFSIKREEIISALSAKNITYGIEEEAIDFIVQNPHEVSDVKIAIGKPHINGKDGEIIYKIKKDKKIKPKILPNGNVDFKDLSFITSIKKGQILAEMIPPTKGSKGTTVTNKVINAKSGKMINFKFGKNVELSEDSMALIASADGTIVFDGDKITIIELLEIKGDVGVKTGNIKFSGKVIVNGSLTSGYIIDCDDDLEIRGIVESAEVICKGNVLISSGIQGNDLAKLNIKGDLVSNFINNCSCKVGGDIESGSIMHSNIVCDGSIHLKGKSGLLVGGEVNVRKEILAKTIGSDMGTLTKLTLGIDSEIIKEYQTITDMLKETKESKKKLEQLINLLTRQLKSDKDNEETKLMLEKTKLSKKQINMEFMELSEKFVKINEFINELQGAKVAAGIIHVGTMIKIGNSNYNVKNTLKGVELYREKGQIVAVAI